MRFCLLFAVLPLWCYSTYGVEVDSSSILDVDYILKGKPERVAFYKMRSLSNEYCVCVDQLIRKEGAVFRCSVFLHTNQAYVVWQDVYFSEARQFVGFTGEMSALSGGADIKCEVKTISPVLAHDVQRLHALGSGSRYERMAWGSGIGHVVVGIRNQEKEFASLYDRPVWGEEHDLRKVSYCRDVYGEESACRYACFLRVYRLLQDLLITDSKRKNSSGANKSTVRKSS